jgi:hypothetical protein
LPIGEEEKITSKKTKTPSRYVVLNVLLEFWLYRTNQMYADNCKEIIIRYKNPLQKKFF